MSGAIIGWHPKFNVVRLDNHDVILIGDGEEILLPHDKMPFLFLIDGQKSLDELTSGLENPTMAALLIYFSRRLLSKDVLVEVDPSDPVPVISEINTEKSLPINDQVVLINQTQAPEAIICNWHELFSSLVSDIPVFQESSCIVLVDDLLTAEAEDLIEQYSAVLVVKIAGNELRLSPVWRSDEKRLYDRLNASLLANQPLRQWLMTNHPSIDLTVPITGYLDFGEIDYAWIRSAIVEHISDSSQDLTILNPREQTVQQHPVNRYFVAGLDSNEHMCSAVELTSRVASFNADGGSRQRDPKDTVETVERLISSVTGVLSSLSELSPEQSGEIKTFQSGFAKVPAVFEDRHLSQDMFFQNSLGKGVSPWQSKASALCEAIERYAALYTGKEPSVLATPNQLDCRYYSYDQIAPFSESQYAAFAEPERIAPNLRHFCVNKYDGSEIHWMKTWSLSNEELVAVPLSLCFNDVPYPERNLGRWNSNGCSAGNTLEEAIFQGMLELIERDATAQWWYNQLEMPEFPLEQIAESNRVQLNEALSAEHHYWVLDITSDIGVPVMAAVAQHKDTGKFSLGFGCHILPELAAQRALTEVCQMLAVRKKHMAPFDFDAILDLPYLKPSEAKQHSYQSLEMSDDLKVNVMTLVERLSASGLETLVLDYSRAHLPIRTAKIFIPGLCHIWPQLANERLYSVPVKLGWLTEVNTEESINPQALYI